MAIPSSFPRISSWFSDVLVSKVQWGYATKPGGVNKAKKKKTSSLSSISSDHETSIYVSRSECQVNGQGLLLVETSQHCQKKLLDGLYGTHENTTGWAVLYRYHDSVGNSLVVSKAHDSQNCGPCFTTHQSVWKQWTHQIRLSQIGHLDKRDCRVGGKAM